MMTRIVLDGHGFKVRAKIINVWLQTLRGLRADVCPEADHISELIEWLGSVKSGLVLAGQNEAYQRLFESAREKALERLKIDRHKATPHEQGLVAALALQHDVEPGIWNQLDYDLRTYPLYDAMGMWLDSEAGLAAAVPKMMAAVAALFL